MSSLPAKLFSIACASWVLACSGEQSTAPQLSAAAGAASTATENSGGGTEQAFVLPPNSSFETARALTTDEDTMQRVVNESQVDYYSFEARAGVFYVLSTDVSRFAPNNVITVFDPDRTMIAENDDGSLFPNDHIDARVIVRPERTGTYYLTVEDRVLDAEDPEGRLIPPLFYRLSLREITADTAGYALETNDQDPTALVLQQDPATQTRYVTLLGDLSDEDTSDAFEIHGLSDYALIGELLATGVKGDGSSASTVGVRVTADSDGHLLASCGLASGQSNVHPPVDDAMYRIQITAGDQVGSNGFYAIDLVLLSDNPHERTEADNNSLGSAEPLALSGSNGRRGLLLSRLPAQDVDYYRFSAEVGERMSVNCEGESGGSGVRGLQAEVLAPSMQSLVVGREARAKALWIEPFELALSGTYYLKLSSETPAVSGAAEDAVEPWARCAVIVGR